MKKTVALLITFLLTASMAVAVSAVNFSDLAAEHWAYNNVMTLVNEGTVNGYEDGTFKPSKTVTRAEFVKMIGKWDRAYQGSISDLSSSHWGYEYLIWSGLEPVDGKIYPDVKMLRSDVINLIWKRNGSPVHNGAPYVISNQGTNKSATSWAYTIGLIQGDDGFNLRLDSALTRAEAATLILRARTLVAENKQYNFKDVVDEKLLIRVFDSANIFEGMTYDAAKTVTNAEMARAAMVLSAGGKQVAYGSSTIDTDNLFDHPYTKDLHVLAEKVWGMEYYTPAMADKPATVQDALSALVYGLTRRSGNTANLKNMNTYYSDCKGAASTAVENLCLSYAADNGMKLTAGNVLGAANQVTLKDIAVFLLELDATCGIEWGFDAKGVNQSAELNKDLAKYPGNSKDFRSIIEGVPTSAYQMKEASTKPVEYYSTAVECAFIFTGFLNSVETSIKSAGTQVSFTFYPALTYEENNRITFVVKGMLKGTETKAADTVFAKFLKNQTGITLVPEQEFYVAFETYEPLMALYMPASAAYIKSIILAD